MGSGEGEGKLPGKTRYSGRRRSATRTSGFHAHEEQTGAGLKVTEVQTYELGRGQEMSVRFSLPPCKPGDFVGFGGWFLAPSDAKCGITGSGIPSAVTLTPAAAPDWSKFGSMWIGDSKGGEAIFSIRCDKGGHVALWECACGVVQHKHLSDAREALLSNMYEYSPEAHFFSQRGATAIIGPPSKLIVRENVRAPLYLKSCNRCARFLPVNLRDERKQLSFTNHCVAEHRRPCKHSGFGRLKDQDGNVVSLDYGFQLECRFCKKFEVNAAHNPQRSSAQMKEDGQRRRALELLVSELYQGSPLLKYRQQKGTELADDTWKRFGGRCFKCGASLKNAREMQLDHTRPLAMLWPIDQTATALCKNCNGAKRDRAPADYYTHDELRRLAELTGLNISELSNPSPNADAVAKLRQRLEWFFDVFLRKPELAKIRDGKTAAELLVKALQKVINKSPKGLQFDLTRDFEKRRE